MTSSAWDVFYEIPRSAMMSNENRKRSRTGAAASKHRNVVEINPKGDLVLEVGLSPSVLLRMSSGLLVQVSDVFKAMLEGKFSEGQTIYNANNPLPLPEDEPHAMTLMCKLLMHQIKDVKEIKPTELPALTVTCDKYSCLSPLRYSIQTRLPQYVLDIDNTLQKGPLDYSAKQDDLHYLDALMIAYLIDDGANF